MNKLIFPLEEIMCLNILAEEKKINCSCQMQKRSKVRTEYIINSGRQKSVQSKSQQNSLDS